MNVKVELMLLMDEYTHKEHVKTRNSIMTHFWLMESMTDWIHVLVSEKYFIEKGTEIMRLKLN